MKSILVTAVLLLVAGIASAQTVSPISQEYGHGKATGDVKITNDMLAPMSVTLSVGQFFVKDGKKIPAPLTDDISAKLSAYSIKIPPKQSRIVSYDVKCPAGCNVEVSAALGSPGMRTSDGMLIVLHLGSIAYVAPANEGSKDRRAHVLLVGGVKP